MSELKRWKKVAGPLAAAMLLAPLAACGDDEPTTPTSTTEVQTQGEAMEIDNLVRVHVPAGWEVQTSDTPGLEVYVLTLVPEGTEPQALMPGNERVDFAYLTLSNLGGTRGAAVYASAQRDEDADNTEFYSEIGEIETIEIDGVTFHGYEGTLTSGDHTGPVQYWYGDVGRETVQFDLVGERKGAIPHELVDFMKGIEFLP
ncbi:MAG: hypothetical protein ACTHV1_07140 [Flaviflexus sp.]|uniref:hypothetical protein n=1 Tax=Flaviflexus sp. TaxID=1969482 RepID=UPI003F8DBFB4